MLLRRGCVCVPVSVVYVCVCAMRARAGNRGREIFYYPGLGAARVGATWVMVVVMVVGAWALVAAFLGVGVWGGGEFKGERYILHA